MQSPQATDGASKIPPGLTHGFPSFLTVTSVLKPGLIELENESSNLKGFEGKWLSLLSETLKFQFQLVVPVDNQWGEMDKYGNWSGIIGVLQREEADMAVSYLTITDQRKKVVDFSESYSDPKLMFITNPPEPKSKSLVYLYPFDTPTWMGIFVVLFTLPVLMRFYYQKKLAYSSRFMIVLGHLLNQELLQKYVEKGWFIGTWLMVAFVLSRSYSCLVYSFLTVPLYEKHLSSFQELIEAVKAGKYEVFHRKGAATVHRLRESGLSYIADKSQNLDPYLWGVLQQGGRMGKTSSEKKMALIVYNTGFFLDRNDLAQDNPDGNFELYSNIAVALNKNFCCKPVLDRAIVRLKEAGLYQRILDRESALNVIKMKVNSSPTVLERVLTVDDVSGALFIWFSGMSLSVLCLILEIFVVCAKQKFVK